MPSAVIEDPVERGEQSRPPRQIDRMAARRERVERAGLDQAFEDLLVHEPQVDVFGQLEQRRDTATERLSSGQDGLNRALARAFYRAKAKAHAVRLDRRTRVGWH